MKMTMEERARSLLFKFEVVEIITVKSINETFNRVAKNILDFNFRYRR